jgi:hypothetical protein
MRFAISAIDRSVVNKSALTSSIARIERCIPLPGIRTIRDAITDLDFALPRDRGVLLMAPPVRATVSGRLTAVGRHGASALSFGYRV